MCESGRCYFRNLLLKRTFKRTGVNAVAEDDQALEAFRRGLSERIRGLRAARGMTRKQLSSHSEISERYLAQLEAGEANPSIAVLWRIAEALGLEFYQLLADADKRPVAHAGLWQLLQGLSEHEQAQAHAILSKRLPNKQRERSGLALIGMRGAGKTTLGRAVAKQLNLPFARLSEMIESLGGMEIGELFSLGGQKAYRRLERQALEVVIERGSQVVVEVGGSLVSERATFERLREAFHTVWLRADPEDHMNRVARQGDTRPMKGNAQAMADLNRILAEREGDYGKADFVLETSGKSIAACTADLTELARGCITLRAAQA